MATKISSKRTFFVDFLSTCTRRSAAADFRLRYDVISCVCVGGGRGGGRGDGRGWRHRSLGDSSHSSHVRLDVGSHGRDNQHLGRGRSSARVGLEKHSDQVLRQRTVLSAHRTDISNNYTTA